jgi:glycopeptide antibiotics resistance protein
MRLKQSETGSLEYRGASRGLPRVLVDVRRVGGFLVLASIAAVLVGTLYPYRFHFALDHISRIDWAIVHTDRPLVTRDFVVNILLLVPLGVGWALLRSARPPHVIVLEAIAVGFVVSASIETLQIFTHVRYPQVADVWRNVLGCGAGAVLSTVALRKLAASRILRVTGCRAPRRTCRRTPSSSSCR